MIGSAMRQYSSPSFVPDFMTVLVPGRQYASLAAFRQDFLGHNQDIAKLTSKCASDGRSEVT